MAQPPLLSETHGAVRIVTINDAPYNRMTLDFMDKLEELVDETKRDDAIRAVVITGAGDQNFSVGMNLKELPRGIEEKGGRDALFDQRLRVISNIENMGSRGSRRFTGIVWVAAWNCPSVVISGLQRKKAHKSGYRRWISARCPPGEAVRASHASSGEPLRST